ncbi:MAG: hypothetical protein MJZ71_08390 [Bacteroidales bacterium]|nr:hypothetical protein [Bacteroidales bacterium]
MKKRLLSFLMLLIFVVLNTHNAYTHCVEESVVHCHTEHHQDDNHCDQLHSALYKISFSKFDNAKHLLSIQNEQFKINVDCKEYSFCDPSFVVKDSHITRLVLLRAPPVK